MQMRSTIYSQQSSDAELILGCQGQHRLAQRHLYQRYYGKLLGVCMRYTSQRSEAEDVLNQAFLKIFQKIKDYREQGNLGNWLATITLRTAIDHVRSQVKYREYLDFEIEKDQPLEAAAIDQLYAEDLYRLIQKLPATSRTVFSMNAIEGFTHREIGEILGISTNTSKWHLAEAKKN